MRTKTAGWEQFIDHSLDLPAVLRTALSTLRASTDQWKLRAEGGVDRTNELIHSTMHLSKEVDTRNKSISQWRDQVNSLIHEVTNNRALRSQYIRY